MQSGYRNLMLAVVLAAGCVLAYGPTAQGASAGPASAIMRQLSSPLAKNVLPASGKGGAGKEQPGKKRTVRLQAGQRLDDGNRSAMAAQEVMAGWYGKELHGQPMANGRPFDMDGATIAHRSLPLGTRVELENPKTGERAEAVVTDRGPYHRHRDLDLSYGLAKRLSLARKGGGRLKMRVLSNR